MLRQGKVEQAHEWWCDHVEAWLIKHFADKTDFRLEPPRGGARFLLGRFLS